MKKLLLVFTAICMTFAATAAEQTKKLKAPYYVTIGNKDVNKQKDFGKSEYVTMLKKKVKTHKKILSPNFVFEKNKHFINLFLKSPKFPQNFPQRR